MQEDKFELMLAVVEDCVKKNQLEFLANILCKLQKEYREICELSTDGHYQITWTHQQVLDHLTYNQKY
ncbi:hypothetical protein EB001_01885 [bacterium]|jgi:hypothetical protein|nr:hypothetical protein [bacterium]